MFPQPRRLNRAPHTPPNVPNIRTLQNFEPLTTQR